MNLSELFWNDKDLNEIFMGPLMRDQNKKLFKTTNVTRKAMYWSWNNQEINRMLNGNNWKEPELALINDDSVRLDNYRKIKPFNVEDRFDNYSERPSDVNLFKPALFKIYKNSIFKLFIKETIIKVVNLNYFLDFLCLYPIRSAVQLLTD